MKFTVSLLLSFLFYSNCLLATESSEKQPPTFEFFQFTHPTTYQERLAHRKAVHVSKEEIDNADALLTEFHAINKETPLLTFGAINHFYKKLSGNSAKVYFKDETVNPTGSFKDRMPILFYQSIKAKKADKATTIIAVSTGNHGKASAHAATVANEYFKNITHTPHAKIDAKIFLDHHALSHKKAAIRAAGGEVVESANGKKINSYAEAESLALKEKRNNKQAILLNHADSYAVNGYATIATEIDRQAKAFGISIDSYKEGEVALLTPLGSGGLLSGNLQLVVNHPKVHAIGVVAPPADITYRSLKAHKIFRSKIDNGEPLIVDGIMATPERTTMRLIPDFAYGLMRINQTDALYATALLKLNHINVEPTSGLPLAAFLLGDKKHLGQTKVAFMVLTGRNISDEMEQVVDKIASTGEKGIFAYFKSRRAETVAV